MILDADKEGFLRSERSLIQIIGRCARNSNGRVILYADEITDSMMNAVSETNRRREIQQKYNEEHGIVPKTIIKGIRDVFDIVSESAKEEKVEKLNVRDLLNTGKVSSMDKDDKDKMIKKLTAEMNKAAKELEFEKAAEIRDVIITLKGE